MVEKTSQAVNAVHSSSRIVGNQGEKAPLQNAGDAFVELFHGLLSKTPTVSLSDLGVIPAKSSISTDIPIEPTVEAEESVEHEDAPVEDETEETEESCAKDVRPEAAVAHAHAAAPKEKKQEDEETPADSTDTPEDETPAESSDSAPIRALQNNLARAEVKGHEAPTEAMQNALQHVTAVKDANAAKAAAQGATTPTADPVQNVAAPAAQTAATAEVAGTKNTQAAKKIAEANVLQPIEPARATPVAEPSALTPAQALRPAQDATKAAVLPTPALNTTPAVSRNEFRFTIDRQAINITVDRGIRDLQPSAASAMSPEKRGAAVKDANASTKGTTVNQAKIIDQIQKLIDTAAKLKNGNVISVRLDPEEIGAVTVRVTQRADQVFARVIPESKEVEAMLRSNLQEVVQALSNSGFKTENIHVSIGHELPENRLMQFERQGAGNRKPKENGARQQGLSEERGDTSGSMTESSTSDAGWVA